MNESNVSNESNISNESNVSNYILTENLKTGDIILCHGENKDGHLDPGLDGLIEFFTKSPWEHAGIIIVDPWWFDIPNGTYIFQAGGGPNNYKDVLNGNVSGCTLNHLSDFLANRHKVYARQLENFIWDDDYKMFFQQAFEISHGKPYDKNILQWITVGLGSFLNCKLLKKCLNQRHTNNFWCSALVGYMYNCIDCIDDDWSCLTPEDLVQIKLLNNYSLGELKILKE